MVTQFPVITNLSKLQENKVYQCFGDGIPVRKSRCNSNLENWQVEIGRMFRFTRSNGITEGFHRKMKLIQRRAYGFRNFENYRLRIRVLCA